ncbi:ABC transporter permease [Singulisphaera sp. PoT]|uniref:ABC transporter permease n=1 Tax=Singulisphaera sp. PoT TaxID=3411797 RepID=UPI003BF51DDF
MSAPTSSRLRGEGSILCRAVAPLVVLPVLIGAWYALKAVSGLPDYVIPGPKGVLLALHEHRATLLKATIYTTKAAACGLGVSLALGMPIALVLSLSRTLRAGIFPYLTLLQTVPIVAVANAVIIALGHGFPSIVCISASMGLFPVIASTLSGLTSVDPRLLELFQLHNASLWKTWTKLRLPSAVRDLASGAKIAAGLSSTGAVVGEYFVGSEPDRFGLAYIIYESSRNVRADLMYAATAAAIVLGISLFAALGFVESVILARWSRR